MNLSERVKDMAKLPANYFEVPSIAMEMTKDVKMKFKNLIG